MIWLPLVAYHQNLKGALKGARVDRQVRAIDLAPTMLNLAGLKIPAQMDGVSLRPHLTGGIHWGLKDLEAFSQVGLNTVGPNKDLIAITTREWKYIFDFLSGKDELYDLTTDPKEAHNLAGEQQPLVARYRQRVYEFKAKQLKKRLRMTPEAEIDEELEAQLKSLGYL